VGCCRSSQWTNSSPLCRSGAGYGYAAGGPYGAVGYATPPWGAAYGARDW
jgi:hypothetical protein